MASPDWPITDPLCYLIGFMCKKNYPRRQVRVPETVIYEHNFARAWYYYEGDILYKKTGREVTDTSAIYNSLLSHASPTCPIVAIYVTYADDNKTKSVGRFYTGRVYQDTMYNTATEAAASVFDAAAAFGMGDDKFHMRHLTAEQLRTFLNERGKGERGILQQFTPPRGRHTDVIKVVWTPSACMVHRRQNVHEKDDPSLPLHERVMAEKPYVNHVAEVQLAPYAMTKVRSLSQKIAVDIQTMEHKHIAKMVMFMKQDRRANVWIQFAPLIDAHDKPPTVTIAPPSGHHQVEAPPTNSNQQQYSQADQQRAREEFDANLVRLAKLDKINSAPVAIQYQYFKAALLAGPVGSPLLMSTPFSPFSAVQGITPKQSMLLRKFEELVNEVEYSDYKQPPIDEGIKVTRRPKQEDLDELVNSNDVGLTGTTTPSYAAPTKSSSAHA
eukprot:TRINITY_DN68702_c0_g1_i1.p1 TRINITY_DN68702_c0_g1~~TRINITY_DN68702_c0_g1_i1.p1  ORF type:complete len:441 (+),score=41.48 TRINITY_DN68702_c0_g1_i1:66-1388(+)